LARRERALGEPGSENAVLFTRRGDEARHRREVTEIGNLGRVVDPAVQSVEDPKRAAHRVLVVAGGRIDRKQPKVDELSLFTE
jgi:hypothetical protein